MIGQKHRWIIVFSVFALLALGACEKEETQPPATPEEKAAVEKAPPARAVADLKPTAGNEATGTVTFTSHKDAVLVTVEAKGLAPGLHGFHIHEHGDCSAMDAASAGGHFNPDATPHGAAENPPAQRHLGDLGNLEAGVDGTARYERTDSLISLSGPNSIVGKAVIVHAQADDLTSQPTGNAGPRVACGVIQAGE
jgi:Cu-Zn family superoxide dismutase